MPRQTVREEKKEMEKIWRISLPKIKGHNSSRLVSSGWSRVKNWNFLKSFAARDRPRCSRKEETKQMAPGDENERSRGEKWPLKAQNSKKARGLEIGTD